MDAITDPKILAIMSKLNNDPQPALPAPEDGKKGAGDPDRPTRPPLTLEEFIKAEHLDDWPLPLTSEKFMGAPEDKDMIGSEEAIMKQLTDATPVDMKFLTALEDRLQGLEDRLHVYASQIVAMGDPGNKSLVSSEKILPSLGRTFMTDMQASDAVKVHPSRKSKKKMDFKESLLETKKKGVEYCVFPGFRHGELTELPAQLEAPQILNRVTKAQDFNPGFKKFWKKIFQSEASVAIMQDTFWWIFIDIFQQKKASKDKDHLFDRIADSFVALFTSIHPEIKDKFFQVYSDCLGQAVFAVFREAFPESDRSFGDEFKTRLLNVVSEWIAGIRPPPKQWQKWDLKRLEPRVHKMAEDNQTQAAKTLLDSSNKDVSYSLDVDDFKRQVARLGQNNTTSTSRVATAATNRRGVSRDGGNRPLALTNGTSSSTVAPALLALNAPSRAGASPSRMAECGSPKRPPYQSHQVGPGPELQRTLFNLQGHSPLVAHYLRMRQLRGPDQPGRRVRRTEITKLPPKALTYKQVIEETLTKSDTLSKEYQQICDMTNQEIAKIERQQREMNKNISRLQKELMVCKNSMEVKILSESILDKRERDAAMLTSKDKGRGSDTDL